MRPNRNGPPRNRQNIESANDGRTRLNVNTRLLRLFSVINVITYSVCVGLEVSFKKCI